MSYTQHQDNKFVVLVFADYAVIRDTIFHRLESLAKKTGRTPTYYLRESVEEHIEDLEDLYLAERVLEEIRSGEEAVLSNEEFWHGLDD